MQNSSLSPGCYRPDSAKAATIYMPSNTQPPGCEDMLRSSKRCRRRENGVAPKQDTLSGGSVCCAVCGEKQRQVEDAGDKYGTARTKYEGGSHHTCRSLPYVSKPVIYSRGACALRPANAATLSRLLVVNCNAV